jgi:hypothetical protein
MARATKDELLLKTETPQEQVDRMGNGWKLEGQYRKQLELPVHMLDPNVRMVHHDQGPDTMGYETVCGLVLTEVTLRSTDDPDDVTCKACQK